MNTILLAFALLVLLAVVIVFVVIMPLVKMVDHYEMLSLALADYLIDSYNFDISHYPNITEQEIYNLLKYLMESKKEELQRKCNDKTEPIFDE